MQIITSNFIYKLISNLLYFFVEICESFYYVVKLYRFLCIFKIFSTQIPLYNPYEWPLNIVHVLTAPYFKIWSKIIPFLKFPGTSFDFSVMIALEFLTAILTSMKKLRLLAFVYAQYFTT